MFRLNFVFKAIGDQVCTTAIPENLFNATGKKCIITDKSIWPFQHNPYVDHMDVSELPKETLDITLLPDSRDPAQVKHYQTTTGCVTVGSQTEYMLAQLGIDQPELRHPRLYIYEDLDIVPQRVVVNTTGSDRTLVGEPAIRYYAGEDSVRVMSDDVINSILKNYRDYEIVQIGASTDKPIDGKVKDLRGQLDYWGSAREIAQSAIFIGVNSGPMHLANCYPRTVKKIVLQEFPAKSLRTWRPGDTRNFLFSWIDPSSTMYNKFDFDVGPTYAHTKI